MDMDVDYHGAILASKGRALEEQCLCSNDWPQFIMLKHTEGNKFIIFNVYTSENFENEKM